MARWIVPAIIMSGVAVYIAWNASQKDKEHIDAALCAMRLEQCVTRCEQEGLQKTDVEERRLHRAGCRQNCAQEAKPECRQHQVDIDAALCTVRLARCVTRCKQEGLQKTDGEERKLHLAGCLQNCAKKTRTELECP
jgi:hypothetical protein